MVYIYEHKTTKKGKEYVYLSIAKTVYDKKGYSKGNNQDNHSKRIILKYLGPKSKFSKKDQQRELKKYSKN